MHALVLSLLMTASLDPVAVAKLLDLPLTETTNLETTASFVRASSAPVTLLGTMTGRYAAALVLDGTRGRTLYVGDSIAGAIVADIAHDRLILDRDGALEEVHGHKVAASAPADVPRVSLAALQGDWPKLITQIKAVPVSNGFKLFAIAPDSLFARIGLKNGDVIVGGLDLLQKLKPGPVTVEILRDGRGLSLSGWID